MKTFRLKFGSFSKFFTAATEGGCARKAAEFIFESADELKKAYLAAEISGQKSWDEVPDGEPSCDKCWFRAGPKSLSPKCYPSFVDGRKAGGVCSMYLPEDEG